MMTELHLWYDKLSQPEYLHVLLNPLPTHGALLGSVVLVVAILARSRPAQVAALGVILISCSSVWLVMHYGDQAYDRVTAMSYSDARAWLEVHEDRADDLAWIFYVTAVVALLAMLAPERAPRLRNGLVFAALLLALVSQLAGGWIAHAGGQVRHKEFRDGPPPASALEDMHEHGNEHEYEHDD